MAEGPITKPMDRDVNTYHLQSLPLFDMLDRERGTMINAQAPSGTQSQSSGLSGWGLCTILAGFFREGRVGRGEELCNFDI